jgi:DNA ligase 1
MKRFTELFCALEQTTRTNEKVEALETYFRDAPPADAAWALRFLCGRTLPRVIPSRNLWTWIAEEAQLPAWLVAECFDAVGDAAETMALLAPSPRDGIVLPLARLIEERLLPLPQLPEHARHDLLLRTWRELNSTERLVWNKLITGNFRIGVARTLVIRALASVARVTPAVMAHRVLGSWNATAEEFVRLTRGEEAGSAPAQPYPFFLASPLELKLKPGESLDILGDRPEWQAEWKWDGIRAQLIRRGGEVILWSRGDEMITDSFPELVEAGAALPEGVVLDGEILAWQGNRPLPFAALQRRLGRKLVESKTRRAFPITFVAYDLLEWNGQDCRTEPLAIRRQRLEQVMAETERIWAEQARAPAPAGEFLPGFELVETPSDSRRSALRLSPIVRAETWTELAAARDQARLRGVEGLMLKRLTSGYGVGRQRGDWWKWKVDPFLVDAVLVAAQRGHGRRASLYTDYTFAVWDHGQLVPVAKAYSGLTDEEILRVDAFVRGHTVERFGPVRSVDPRLVFELAFEGVQKSTRHKSGLALRFPRMNRWRHDKKADEADTLEQVQCLAAQAEASGREEQEHSID